MCGGRANGGQDEGGGGGCRVAATAFERWGADNIAGGRAGLRRTGQVDIHFVEVPLAGLEGRNARHGDGGDGAAARGVAGQRSGKRGGEAEGVGAGGGRRDTSGVGAVRGGGGEGGCGRERSRGDSKRAGWGLQKGGPRGRAVMRGLLEGVFLGGCNGPKRHAYRITRGSARWSHIFNCPFKCDGTTAPMQGLRPFFTNCIILEGPSVAIIGQGTNESVREFLRWLSYTPSAAPTSITCTFEHFLFFNFFVGLSFFLFRGTSLREMKNAKLFKLRCWDISSSF